MRVNDKDAAMWLDVPPDAVDMIHIECPSCGGHLGIDATYLLRVGPVETTCPYCAQDNVVTECYVPEFE